MLSNLVMPVCRWLHLKLHRKLVSTIVKGIQKFEIVTPYWSIRIINRAVKKKKKKELFDLILWDFWKSKLKENPFKKVWFDLRFSFFYATLVNIASCTWKILDHIFKAKGFRILETTAIDTTCIGTIIESKYFSYD